MPVANTSRNPDNMRSTLDQCLYNQSQVASSAPVSACVGLCAPIKDSIEINLDSPDKSSPYQHCVNPTFVQNATSCAKCYAEETNDQIYLSNCKCFCASCMTPFNGLSLEYPGEGMQTDRISVAIPPWKRLQHRAFRFSFQRGFWLRWRHVSKRWSGYRYCCACWGFLNPVVLFSLNLRPSFKKGKTEKAQATAKEGIVPDTLPSKPLSASTAN